MRWLTGCLCCSEIVVVAARSLAQRGGEETERRADPKADHDDGERGHAGSIGRLAPRPEVLKHSAGCHILDNKKTGGVTAPGSANP